MPLQTEFPQTMASVVNWNKVSFKNVEQYYTQFIAYIWPFLAHYIIPISHVQTSTARSSLSSRIIHEL